jgi:acylphosphatase
MTEKQLHQLHAVVHGRVQGVGFRDATQRRAIELGLTGWVRNLPERAVETVAEGERAALEQFLAWLRRGPQAAHVEQVDHEWLSATGRFQDFHIR